MGYFINIVGALAYALLEKTYLLVAYKVLLCDSISLVTDARASLSIKQASSPSGTFAVELRHSDSGGHSLCCGLGNSSQLWPRQGIEAKVAPYAVAATPESCRPLTLR